MASDLQDVQAIVVRVAHHIDGKRWPELRALFHDTVQTDYTSLFGGQVQNQAGDDLIAAWRGLLGEVVTQHLLGPVDAVIDGMIARAECHVRAYHVRAGDEWMVAGHYVFELRRAAGAWKITRMKLEALHQTGNRNLLQGG